MNRRSFLQACLVAASAPAFVRAESLMKLWIPPEQRILKLWGDGWHDDTAALQRLIDLSKGMDTPVLIPRGKQFLTTAPLVLNGSTVYGQGSYIIAKHDGAGFHAEGEQSHLEDIHVDMLGRGYCVWDSSFLGGIETLDLG